jgi:hypothetical protein
LIIRNSIKQLIFDTSTDIVSADSTLNTVFFKPKKLAANLIEEAGSDLQLSGADEYANTLDIEEYYRGAIENNHNIK